MSSSTLVAIQNELNYYGYPLILILGNVGNIMIIIIYNRQRHNACSFYVYSLAIINNIYATYNCLIRLFPYSFLTPSVAAFVYCKIRFYISGTFGQVAKAIIVLASIDRYMITNDDPAFRRLSTLKLAKLMILFSFMFWLVAGCHIPILVTVNFGVCAVFGIYAIFFSTYVLLGIGLLPPTISAIFTYLTHRNLKLRRTRVQPMAQTIPRISRRDRDLLILVWSEVVLYIVITTLYPIILTEMSVTRYLTPNKSSQQSVIENFVFTIATLLAYSNHGASFYMYLLISKVFRQDVRRLLINSYRKLRGLPLIDPVRRTNQTFTNQGSRP